MLLIINIWLAFSHLLNLLFFSLPTTLRESTWTVEACVWVVLQAGGGG